MGFHCGVYVVNNLLFDLIFKFKFLVLSHLVLINWFLFLNILALKMYILVSLNWSRCFLLMLLRMPLSWSQNYGPTTIQHKLKPIRNIYQGICLLVIVTVVSFVCLLPSFGSVCWIYLCYVIIFVNISISSNLCWNGNSPYMIIIHTH